MEIVFGILSVVFAIIGIFVATIPLGIVSIILGIIGLITNQEKDTAALSIVGRAVSFIAIIIRLIMLA